MKRKLTDTERLDALQKCSGTYNIICRMSETGCGWRLHQTTRNEGVKDIREAIDKFLDENPHYL